MTDWLPRPCAGCGATHMPAALRAGLCPACQLRPDEISPAPSHPRATADFASQNRAWLERQARREAADKARREAEADEWARQWRAKHERRA